MGGRAGGFWKLGFGWAEAGWKGGSGAAEVKEVGLARQELGQESSERMQLFLGCSF